MTTTDTAKINPCAEIQSRGLVDGPDSGRTLLGAGRPTIYGDYVALSVASRSSRWHIQGEEPDTTLCGERLTGDLRWLNLHVSLLECSTCMKMGGSRDQQPDTVEDDVDCWCGSDRGEGRGEGCYCCTEDCPEYCMADHKGEQ